MSLIIDVNIINVYVPTGFDSRHEIHSCANLKILGNWGCDIDSDTFRTDT